MMVGMTSVGLMRSSLDLQVNAKSHLLDFDPVG
jgi:hypothetical protein